MVFWLALAKIENILLVDDDSINNFVNLELIGNAYPDSDIKVFENPVDAVEFLENDEVYMPDFILLDLNMPFLTGWQFLDRLTGNETDYNIAILTSSINPSDKNKAQHYDMVKGFLVKPIDIKKLLQIFPTN